MTPELTTYDDGRPGDPYATPGRRLSPWWIGLLGCTLLGLLWAVQYYYMYVYDAAPPLSWPHALGWGMFSWYLWGALALVVVRLARRFPFGRSRWIGTLAIHAVCASLISACYLTVTATFWWALRPDDGQHYTWGHALGMEVLLWLPWNMLTYGAILGVIHAFEYHRAYRERTVRAMQLETQLARAQLEALKMQLHPHFLFNALHAISALIHEDPDTADRMVARLSELVRHVLDSGDQQEVPLEQELDFLRKYLEIERVRFGDRLDVHFSVEPDTLGAAVPDLILQPLVENSIRHALSPHAGPCRIEINAKRDGNMLGLSVVDSGAADVDVSALCEGVGLTNTRTRLRRLYGDRHDFELRGRTSGGLAAYIRIPLTNARADSASESSS